MVGGNGGEEGDGSEGELNKGCLGEMGEWNDERLNEKGIEGGGYNYRFEYEGFSYEFEWDGRQFAWN